MRFLIRPPDGQIEFRRPHRPAAVDCAVAGKSAGIIAKVDVDMQVIPIEVGIDFIPTELFQRFGAVDGEDGVVDHQIRIAGLEAETGGLVE